MAGQVKALIDKIINMTSMKNLFLLIIAAGLILDGCGGGLEMTMKPSTSFKLTSPVAVRSGNFDGADLRPKIEEALFRNGVNVMSPSFARTEIQLQDNSNNQPSNQSSQGTSDSASVHSSRINGQGNEYLLEFTYDFEYTLSGKLVTDFSAAIVEPQTGEVVGIISYHGKGDGVAPDELANSVGKKISQQLK
ncbi:MAG TPA: hypothetical protein VLX91_17095 [Candidatus Acidoferrales bacterium]|nr:hypothetical protein [Candidatus Acidoferrales bacterium]